MSIDLRNLSAKELGALIEKAKQQQTRLAKRTPIATVRSKITKFAKAEGYTLEELFGMSGNRGAKGAAKPPRKPPRLPAPNPHASWAKGPPSTATPPTPRKPGAVAASNHAGWPP